MPSVSAGVHETSGWVVVGAVGDCNVCMSTSIPEIKLCLGKRQYWSFRMTTVPGISYEKNLSVLPIIASQTIEARLDNCFLTSFIVGVCFHTLPHKIAALSLCQL